MAVPSSSTSRHRPAPGPPAAPVRPRGVDRSSPVPLWAQVRDDLRARVGAGEFEGGFPTEGELTRAYEVSRHTVREALRRLEGDGLLVRQRGRGTSLARPRLEQPLHALYSLAASVRSQGLDERSDVRLLVVGEAGEAAGALGIGPDEEVVRVERVRYAGGEPLALDTSVLPARLAAPLLGVELSSGALYEALARHCGIRVAGGHERIRPVEPSPEERALLELPVPEAVFAIERLALGADGERVEWRRSLVRGDRYEFVARWDESASPPVDPVRPGP